MNILSFPIIAGLTLAATSAYAIDLSADVSLGNTSVSANVGGGSITADANVAGDAVTADVDIGHSGNGGGTYNGGGNGGAGMQAGGTSTAAAQGGMSSEDDMADGTVMAMLQAAVGNPVVSSDNLVLGRLTRVQSGETACPTLAIRPNADFGVVHDTVWLQSKNCQVRSGQVHLSMHSRSFFKVAR